MLGTQEKSQAAVRSASLTKAYRQGMLTRGVVAQSEDREKYDQVLQNLYNQFQPRTPSEEYLVKQATDASWRLDRLKGIEAALLGADEIDSQELDRISRWQVRMESSYFKAYNELKRLLKLRDEANIEEAPAKEALEQCVYWWDPVTNKRQQIAGPPQEYDPAREIGPHKNNIPYSDPNPNKSRLRTKP